MKQITLAADGEWRGMILFGLYTGQRLGDIAILTKKNLFLAQSEVCLTTDKTNRRQILPLAVPLRKYIKTLTLDALPMHRHSPALANWCNARAAPET